MPDAAAKTTKKTKKTAARKKKTVRKATKKQTTAGATLRVRQVKSGIGHARVYRRTLEALGIRHHQQEVTLPDNPSVRGMIFKVRHLVRVTEEA